MSLVEALWRMGDLERELVKAWRLRRELKGKLLPPFGASLVLAPADRDGAVEIADALGQALVRAAAELGKIERELHGLHALR